MKRSATLNYIVKQNLILLILILSANHIQARKIEGHVIDNQKAPLEFVNVILFSLPDSVFITGTTTDSTGYFAIENITINNNHLLQVSCIGYTSFYQEVNPSDLNEHLDSIILNTSSIDLDEVTVTVSRPIISSKGGVLTTSIANTLLSNEHSVTDILSKIPGIINNRGTIEVFGSGEPVIYINNRKVQSISEIVQLDVKNIKNIELITNPGTQYDADTKAVMIIHTLKRTEGISAQVGAGVTMSEKSSHNENIRFGYADDKLSTSLYYSYYDYANKSSQHLIKDVQVDTLWQYETDRNSLPTQKIHSYNFNIDYEFSKLHNAGLQLSGTRRISDDYSEETNIVSADNAYFTTFDTESSFKIVTDNPQLNLFYNADWNDCLSSELNLDYVYYNNDQKQDINEFTPDNTVSTKTDSRSKYNVYSSKYVMKYNPFLKSSLVFGVDFSLIDGYGNLRTLSDMINPIEYESLETKSALFVEYGYKGDKLSLSGGLRYEKIESSYTDLLEEENNVKESYKDFYPSLRISHSDKGINNSFSFSIRTQRPSLSYLNSKTYYQSQFMYQQGNPLLKPQKSYILEYLFGYKFINFSTSYTRTKNYISATFVSSPINPAVIVSTWDNFKKADFLRANINLQGTVKLWSPSLSVGVIKPFLESEYQGKSFTYNKLNYYIMSNNYINLPGDYILSVNYYFNNGGNQRIFTFEPFQSLNIGMQKYFFNDQLSLSMRANDIFRTLDYKENAEINNMRFIQNENYSEWNFSISAIYRFNQKTFKYRGKSSAQNEIRRL